MTVRSTGCKPSLPPTISSISERIKSAFKAIGFSSSKLRSMSMGLMWWGLSGAISMTCPPSRLMSGEYSPMGSTTIIRSLVARNTFTSSLFAAKDLPEPGTPRNRPLGFLSFFRFAIITLWDKALRP